MTTKPKVTKKNTWPPVPPRSASLIPLYEPSEAARLASERKPTSITLLRLAVRRGDLACLVTVGGRKLFARKHLDAWVEERLRRQQAREATRRAKASPVDGNGVQA